jgi:hypothetical protein
MASIDELIAGAGKTNANFNFDQIINGPARAAQQSAFQAQDQQAKNDIRDAFKNGVPTDANGQPDFAAMAKILFQKGGLDQGIAASNLGIQRQQLQMGMDAAARMGQMDNGGQPQQPALISPPSSNRNASATVAPPLNRGGATPSGGATPQQGGTTIMQVLNAQGIPNDQLGPAGASIARQLGVDDPNAPIDLNDPQVRNVIVPAIAQLKRMGVGNVVPPGQPTPPPQVVPPVQGPQNVPVNPAANPGVPQVAPPTGIDQSARAKIAFLTAVASNPAYPKSVQDAAKLRLQGLQSQIEPTGTMKEYNLYVSQGGRLPFDDWQAEVETGKAASTEQAKADIKEQQDIIADGRSAMTRLNTLNTVANIVQSDKNLTLGFGGETALKLKKALEQLGINVGDLSGAQTIEKLNAALASEAAKSVSARPAQFEFKTFLANNPGLSLDKAGNLRVLGIFSQLAKRDVDLGRLARANRDNWQNWDNVVQQYDKAHPILDPVTKNVLSTDSVIAPGPSGSGDTTAQRPLAPPQKGDIVNGHQFLGGNPKDKSAWAPIT